MKRIVFLSLFAMILVIFGSGKTFAFFEKKMYCQMNKGSIVISLKSDHNDLCSQYIKSLEVSMKKVYIDILAVQKYLDQKQDLGYRKPIKEKKVALLNTLQTTRLDILSHMKSFEKNLFTKSKTYFLDSIVDYQKKLKRSLLALQAGSDSLSQRYITLIQKQLSTIDLIANSQTFEEMNVSMQTYIYLKQQLLGK